MIYVLDTNVFSSALINLDLSVFIDIYSPWSSLIAEGRIVSCHEVFRELGRYFQKEDENLVWLNSNKACFQEMTDEEGKILRDIYSHRKFQEGVKEKNILQGNPEADAMLVAKAKACGGVVVTCEKNYTPNSAKIPTIAVTFGVKFMPLPEFYRMLKNLHNGNEELLNVQIYDHLLPRE